MRLTYGAVLTLLVCFPASPSLADEVSRERAAELMEWCQRARAQKLAPLKADAIEQCVQRQGWDRETCERRNNNFGERRSGPNGMVPGMFWDSELCVKALDADHYFRRNPRAQSYTPG